MRFGKAWVVGGAAGALGAAALPMSSAATPNTHIVRIGLEAPLTGSQSSIGIGMLRGAVLAADQINARGGVIGPNGKPGFLIKIVKIDDAADPATGVAAAKRAITAGLNGVVGPYNSGVGERTLPLYLKAGLVPFRLTSANATSRLGITLQPMTYEIAPVASQALTKWLKAKSVAVIYDSTASYTKAEAEAVMVRLRESGVRITGYRIVPGLDSYTAAVTQAAAAKPSAIYSVVYFPEAGVIAKEVVAEHVAAACLQDYSAYDQGYVGAAGTTAARHCPVVGVPGPTVFPGSARVVGQYERAYHAAPGTWAPYTYDSVKLFAWGVQHAGTYKQAALVKTLSHVVGYRGWTGSITISPKTYDRTPATVVVDAVTARGQFVIDVPWARAVGYTG
jgi:branched-chain amino acid transport system substrate-binding protein